MTDPFKDLSNIFNNIEEFRTCMESATPRLITRNLPSNDTEELEFREKLFEKQNKRSEEKYRQILTSKVFTSQDLKIGGLTVADC